MTCWCALSAVLALTWAACAAGSQQGFVVLCDAGSQHTTLFVFSYAPRVLDGGDSPPFTSVTPVPGAQVEAGPITQYASNLTAIGSYLAPLVAAAQGFVPQSAWAATPFFIQATAGARLLPEPQRAALFAASPFAFQPSNARILAGEEEAAFGWAAVNVLQNTLFADDANAFGSLDLGGDSFEVAFRRSGDVLQGFFPLQLGFRTLPLYAQSYLQFGAAAASQRILALSMAESPTPPHVCPCLPTGYSAQLAVNDSLTAPFVGSSDDANCKRLARALFDKDAPCLAAPCTFDGVYQPPLPANATFVATSVLRAAAGDLGLAVNASLSDFDAATSVLCALNASQLSARFVNVSFAPMFCITARFAHELLDFGLGLSGANFLWLKRVGSVAIDWTIGSALAIVNTQPFSIARGDAAETESDLEDVVWALAAMLVSAIGIAVLCVWHYRRKAEALAQAATQPRGDDGYEPLGGTLHAL